MKEWFKNIRYKIAYAIAKDWIYDLEYRFCTFLDMQTGGRMSKSNYTIDAMVRVANEYQDGICEECYLRNADRSKAIRAFAERLKAKCGLYGEIWESDIDRVLKEMEDKA